MTYMVAKLGQEGHCGSFYELRTGGEGCWHNWENCSGVISMCMCTGPLRFAICPQIDYEIGYNIGKYGYV